ncbi:MAG: family 16 glycoside hydrolase [Planctomycetaceae bacterium]
MRLLSLVCLSVSLLFAAPVTAQEDGFVSLFDGKTLEGWDGNPKFWRVEDGTITGQTTPEDPTNGNTFIIWRGGELADFELRFDYKIVGGNSGVQYRSFEPDPEKQKWVVGGYQGDFEAGKTYSGILYGERFRGILANRGQKTELVRNDGRFEVKVIGSVGDSNEIQSKIKHEDWNSYVIKAEGFHFTHQINGVTTIDCTDNDQMERRPSGILALQLHAGPPMKVQFRNIRVKHLKPAAAADGNAAAEPQKSSEKKKVVFISGRPSHGWGSHEHYAGCLQLADSLLEVFPDYDVKVIKHGWPQEGLAALEGADTVVVYCDGGGGHLLNPHIDEFDTLMDKGTGLVCLHYAVETPAGKPGDAFLKWMGGYFEANWSVNPHWDGTFDKFPQHPICNGVKPFTINDEWYFHMRFRPGMKKVTPILSAHPPESTMSRGDGPHSGNPDVRKSMAAGEIQHVAWAAERDGNSGRGFGFTGGHFHWNWADENFRKVVLNAVVWTAHGDVPENGVTTRNPTREELENNQDEPKPGGNTAAAKKTGRKIKRPMVTTKDNGIKAVPGKPLFSSPVVTKETAGGLVEIKADITGSKKLYLVVNDGGNGFGCDWADWVEPRLTGPTGDKKLTELKWKSATTDFGQVQLNKNAGGGTMKVAGKDIAYGIGAHANSVIEFDLPDGFTHFVAQGGIDNGGTDQGSCGATASVQFQVYNTAPPVSPGSGGGSHDAADAAQRMV